MKNILVLLLVVITGDVYSENTIIAIVNNSPILLNSLQNELLKANSNEKKIEVVNAQIDIFLQLQKVDEFNLKPTEEDISKVLIDIAQSNNLSIDELLNRKELNDIKNNSNLKYIGSIDVQNELHNYDISIVMSKYEGFSRILLESLYVGLFCISNDIPGTSYLNEFSNGCLVKDNNINKFNEIINSFNDYDFSKLNANKNRMLIENNFSTQIISKKYNEIYDNLKSIK